MAKTTTDKPRCQAQVFDSQSRYSSQCKRSAGHGLESCFCKQHSKESKVLQFSWLSQRLRRLKKALAQIDKEIEQARALIAYTNERLTKLYSHNTRAAEELEKEQERLRQVKLWSGVVLNEFDVRELGL